MQSPVRIVSSPKRPVAEQLQELFLQGLLAESRVPEGELPAAEDPAAQLEVHAPDLRRVQADREGGCNDRSGAGPSDEIEVVAQAEIGLLVALAKDRLDALEVADGQGSPYAAAVEGEDALWPVRTQVLQQCHRYTSPSRTNGPSLNSGCAGLPGSARSSVEESRSSSKRW